MLYVDLPPRSEPYLETTAHVVVESPDLSFGSPRLGEHLAEGEAGDGAGLVLELEAHAHGLEALGCRGVGDDLHPSHLRNMGVSTMHEHRECCTGSTLGSAAFDAARMRTTTLSSRRML